MKRRPALRPVGPRLPLHQHDGLGLGSRHLAAGPARLYGRDRIWLKRDDKSRQWPTITAADSNEPAALPGHAIGLGSTGVPPFPGVPSAPWTPVVRLQGGHPIADRFFAPSWSLGQALSGRACSCSGTSPAPEVLRLNVVAGYRKALLQLYLPGRGPRARLPTMKHTIIGYDPGARPVLPLAARGPPPPVRDMADESRAWPHGFLPRRRGSR